MSSAAHAYDVPNGFRAIDCLRTKELSVDTGKATATGIYASKSKDHVGDVLEIKGIDLSVHSKNPLILWLHSFDYRDPDGQKPIGKAEDEDGNFTVKLYDDYAEATTFFSQSTLLAAQVTALVMEKMIRGQSIGYKEKKIERIYEDDRYIGTHLLEVTQLEISWCPIPCNPDAVRQILSRDLCGKSLSPSIRAAPSPYASPAPTWANGFTSEAKNMATPNEKPAAPTPAAIPPVVTKAKKDDEPEEEEAEEKHGSKALRKIFKAVSACGKAVTKAVAGLDDDNEIKTFGDEIAEGCAGHATSIKELHGDRYKDSDPIGDDDDEDEDKPADEKKADDEELSDDEKKALDRANRLESQLKHELRLLRKRPA